MTKEAISVRDVPAVRTPQVPVPNRYDIRVTGHLAEHWATWFDGMTLTAQQDGSTVIHGPVADQSALHGLLRKLSDLGLPLVSVTPRPAEPRSTTPPIPVDRAVTGPTQPRSRT